MSTIEELLERKSSCSCLEIWEYSHRDPSRWPCCTLNPQKLALTLPTSGDRLVSIIHLWTEAIEFFLVVSNETVGCGHGGLGPESDSELCEYITDLSPHQGGHATTWRPQCPTVIKMWSWEPDTETYWPTDRRSQMQYFLCSLCCIIYSIYKTKLKLNSMVWVHERTIPTERPLLVGEVIANFCG
jgi:hypothetical protein